MRHHSNHVSFSVTYACNIINRAVRVVSGILEDHAPFCTEISDSLAVCNVPSLAMRYRKHKALIFGKLVRKWCIVILDHNRSPPANKPERIVHHQRPRKKACLNKNLKAIANAKHWNSFFGQLFYLTHYRAVCCDYACPQPVSISKAAGNYHGIIAGKPVFGVPDIFCTYSNHRVQNVVNITIAVAARKDSDPDLCHLSIKLVEIPRINVYLLPCRLIVLLSKWYVF